MTDDEQVRRLLAEARHTEPMPDDVAARLDEVLAGLREEPAARPVVDLAARRRRRTVRNWLLAAAAVVVLGVGVNQVDLSGMSANDADSGSSAADGGGDTTAAESAPGDVLSPAPSVPENEDSARWNRPRVILTAAKFGPEVQTFRRTLPTRYAALAGEAHADAPLDGGADFSLVCSLGDTGAGARVPVRYDGERAWLVFRKPQGETQVVDLYLCASDRPARSITLPAP